MPHLSMTTEQLWQKDLKQVVLVLSHVGNPSLGEEKGFQQEMFTTDAASRKYLFCAKYAFILL